MAKALAGITVSLDGSILSCRREAFDPSLSGSAGAHTRRLARDPNSRACPLAWGLARPLAGLEAVDRRDCRMG
jgi:hypothetical protein